MGKGINILLLDGDEQDAEQIKQCIAQCQDSDYTVKHILSMDGLQQLCAEQRIDVVLVDLDVANKQSLATVSTLRDIVQDVPVIMLLSANGSDISKFLLPGEADDFIIKKDMTPQVLSLTIKHSLERCKLNFELKRLTENQYYLANHDMLTGLPNRRLLLDRLDQLIAHAARYDHYIAVIAVDLEGFKAINNTLGSDKGDIILKTIAKRIKDNVRSSDTVARVGGDEFVILLTELPSLDVASKTHLHILDVIKQPIKLDTHEFYVGCNLGIALYPNDGKDVESLYSAADAAIEQAKKQCKEFIFYSANINEESYKRLTMSNKLRTAIRHDELRLYYHPLMDVEGNKVYGFEALVRWQHPDLGLIKPDDFIPLAEDTGQIIGLDEWVFHSACRQLKIWNDAGFNDLHLSINISASQFDQPSFLHNIDEIIKETGINPDKLTLELTESTLIQDPQEAIRLLSNIKQSGLKIAVDDFGIGYSSLNYLKHFPIDVIKIDRSFVSDLLTDSNSASIVKAVLALANSLEMDVIAEGVDSQEKEDLMRQNGCHYMQGYLYGKPYTAEQSLKFLKKQ